MATNDLSRASYYPQKRYGGVYMQQGRVLTDDDFNEQERINHEDKRLTRQDIIGGAGSPDAGFSIQNVDDSDGVDFTIKAGTFYLGGLRLALAEDQTFKLQADWLQNTGANVPNGDRRDMIYLEAWQQTVSAVEDSEIMEPALGGPDTTTRRRTMFRVKLAEDVNTDICAEAWLQVIAKIETELGGEMQGNNALVSDARLTVDYEASGDSEDLCSASILAGYLGAENQAIRVQLVDRDHFTWSFDNGAPLYRISLKDAASGRQTIKLITEPKDQAHWPSAGQIVEILPWSAVLENGEKLAEELSPGFFSTISGGYDPNRGEIILTTPVPVGFGEQWKSRDDVNELLKSHFGNEDLENEYFFLRVWNRGIDDTSDPTIVVGPQVKLGKTGLNITIEGSHRLPGDHWIIAARPHTPNRVIPWQLEVKRDPDGYQRFYAPLAIIQWNAQGETSPVVYECRKKFRPLADLSCCCTFKVGDGLHSNGDFNSIEEAVEHLPKDGGRICILPGVHHANLNVVGRQGIHITGCGDRSIIHPRVEEAEQAIFSFNSCNNIKIENLTLFTLTGTAVEVIDDQKTAISSHNITIECNNILALTHGINLVVENGNAGRNYVRILNNVIGMWDKEDGDVAIFTEADDVCIEDNQIMVVPAPNPMDPGDPRHPEGPEGIIYDDCENLKKYYRSDSNIYLFVNKTIQYLHRAWADYPVEYRAKGGIQIAGGSELVKVINNRIIGGCGNGITLGNLPTDAEIGDYFKRKWAVEELDNVHQDYLNERLRPFLYDIDIEKNLIARMGLSGIGVPAFFKAGRVGHMFSIEDLNVYRNRIEGCAHLTPDENLENMLDEIGFGGIVLTACENASIQENRIENNGKSQLEPVCGILIFYAENIVVSNNRIVNNGPRTFVKDDDARAGLRGGVIVGMSFGQLYYRGFRDKELLSSDGISAVKIHDNIITQPFGQALFVMALGPVSVIGNQLTSQGADFKINPFSRIAGAVFIMNLGISKDLMKIMLMSSFKYLPSVNTDGMQSGSGMIYSRGNVRANSVKTDVSNEMQRILYLPNGNVLFADNQTSLDLRSREANFAFSSQLIASLDDVTYNSNQSECNSFIDLVFTDVAILGVTIKSNDNRFQEGFTIALNSLFSFGLMNTATSNQATHCLQVYGAIVIEPIKDGDGNLVPVDGNIVLYKARCSELLRLIGVALAVPRVKAVIAAGNA